MQYAPMLILTVVFLFLGIMISDEIELAKSEYRNLFILALSLLGTLLGWKISVSNMRKDD